MRAMNKTEIVAILTGSNITFDPKAKKEDLAKLLPTERPTVTIGSSNAAIVAALTLVQVPLSGNETRAQLIRHAEDAGIWSQVKKSAVKDSYKVLYGAEQNCGDEMAAILKEISEQEGTLVVVGRIAQQNDLGHMLAAGGKWNPLNPGMQRMNLSNVLRGRVRRGEYVRIDDEEFNVENKPATKKAGK